MSSPRKIEAAPKRKRAFLRLVFGQAQVIGATIAVILLLQERGEAPCDFGLRWRQAL